ncbi:hypothetical protein [Nocardioides sp.]|uniref:hypothetical protein n=1 Tax=Nocardioides sp. TaxID=35761 RepID=UPI00352898E0
MDRSPATEPEGPLVVADDAEAPAYSEAPLAVTVGEEPDAAEPAAHPDWWHRDHPTFTAIAGFFSGLAFATVVPGLFMATIRFFADDSTAERTAEEAFPFVLLFLVIPIGMIVFPQSRRFGSYMIFGIVVALAVVVGVGTFVFWLMIKYAS